jgi:tetratricopeptide (TPR) repeat protein
MTSIPPVPQLPDAKTCIVCGHLKTVGFLEGVGPFCGAHMRQALPFSSNPSSRHGRAPEPAQESVQLWADLCAEAVADGDSDQLSSYLKAAQTLGLDPISLLTASDERESFDMKSSDGPPICDWGPSFPGIELPRWGTSPDATLGERGVQHQTRRKRVLEAPAHLSCARCGRETSGGNRLCNRCQQSQSASAETGTATRRQALATSTAPANESVQPGPPLLKLGALAIALVLVGYVLVQQSGFGVATPGQPTPVVETPVASVAQQESAVPATAPPEPTVAPTPVDPLAEGRAALERGETGRAVEVLAAMEQAAPETPGLADDLVRAYLAHGATALGQSEFDLSYAMFGEVLKRRPDDASAKDGQKQVVLARNWHDMEAAWEPDLNKSIAALDEIMALDPDYRDAKAKLYAQLVRRADNLIREGNRQAAFDNLMRALPLAPDATAARQRLVTYTPTPVPTPTRAPVSLPNGQFLLGPSYARGLGSLSIMNGSDRDAVAKLKITGVGPRPRTTAAIYIRAGQRVILRDIGIGVFVLQFATGHDWDASSGGFRLNESTLKFEEPFEFQEPPTLRGATQYWSIDVTLNRVVGGTARTDGIDPSEFRQD